VAFDGIVLKSLINEFNTKLLDMRIDKIYQPEKDEVVLFLRGYKETYKLFISADSNYPRINLTENSFVNPDKPPLFCMLLRKHISSGKLLSFEQLGSDRIVKIGISSYNEFADAVVKYLIIEIMGRHSNIVLVDEKEVVVDSIKHVDFTVSSKRQLLPGLKYESPPPQEKQDFTNYSEDDLRADLYGEEDINSDKFMQDFFNGISPIVSREIGYRAFKSSKNILTKNDIDKKALFYNTAKQMLADINNNIYTPNILFDNENCPKYFSVIDLNQYENLYSKKYYDSPSKMVETYYNDLHFSRKMKIRSQELTKHINNQIDKIKKKISIHNDTLLSSEKNEKYRLYGELLSANIYMLNGGENSIKVFDYYNNKDIEIDLKSELTPSKNIDRYYKLYKKGKTAEEMAKSQIEIAKNELYYLESELAFLEKAQTQNDINEIKAELTKEGYFKSNEKNKPRRKEEKINIMTFEGKHGYEILVGKNNRQNDHITFKLSKGNDMWLHVKDYPGSHVLIKNKGEEIPDEVILEAAEYASVYSKNSNDKVDVDYTKIKFVKKPPGAKPGMVIYTNYNTVVVNRKVSDSSKE